MGDNIFMESARGLPPTIDNTYAPMPVPDDFLNWQHEAALRTYNRELERQAMLGIQQHNHALEAQALIGLQQLGYGIHQLDNFVNQGNLHKWQDMMPEVAKDFWWQRETLPKLGGILPNARTLPEPWASRFMKFYFVMLALTPAYLLLLCVL